MSPVKDFPLLPPGEGPELWSETERREPALLGSFGRKVRQALRRTPGRLWGDAGLLWEPSSLLGGDFLEQRL